ncbi:MAG: hypothetical protein IJN75_00925 [Clostridia bacterium]|nr:hypothetical protein [Clostridia bacterium]
MKLFHYELKKTILSKGFKSVCLVLLVVSVLLGLVFAEKPSYDVQAVDAIVREYRDDPNAVTKRYHDLEEAYNEYKELLYSDLEIEIDIPEAVIEYEQYKLAFEKINRQKTYIEKLDKTIHELDKQQSVISAEQRVVGDFLKNNYQKNKSLRLGTGDMSGLSNLFSLLGYLLFPIMLFGAFVGTTVSFSDKRRGSELLFYSAPYGRRHTLNAKTATCLFCTIVPSVIAIFISVVVFSVASGFTAFCEYLQNSMTFALYPTPLTVWQAVLILSAFIILAGIFLCLITCLVGKYSKNRVFPLVFSSIVVLLTFLFGVGNSNIAGSISNIGSLFDLCNGNVVFSHIYPVVIGETAIYGVLLVSLVYFFTVVIMCGLYVLHPFRPIEYKTLSLPQLPTLTKRKRVKSVFAYELQKQLFANKTLLLLIAVLLIKLYASRTGYHFDPTYTEQKYHSYMTSIQGEYTEEKHEGLNRELSELYGIIGQKEEMERKYREGEITRTEMGRYLVLFYEAEQNEKALVKANERLEFIKSQIEYGKQPYIVYDTGWNKLLASEIDAVLLVFIIAALCGIYSDEYKNGMNKLYSVCNIRALRRAKIGFCIGISVFAAIAFSAIETIMIAVNFTLPLCLTQASGIEGITLFDSFPLIAYYGLRVFEECIFVSIFSLGVSLISYLTKNKVLTFLLSLSLLLVLLLLI